MDASAWEAAAARDPDCVSRVAVVLGTRPEAIKLAPVIVQLRRRPDMEVFVIHTGQHRDLVDPVLKLFEITPDVHVDLMLPGQELPSLAGRALGLIAAILREASPDFVLVQGDTSSAMAGALAAFYCRIPVGHVEAGLRSFDKYLPFPEEINRRIISVVSDVHFAPTPRARDNLSREAIDPGSVTVTGNTIVDALNSVTESRHFAEVGLPVRPLAARLLLVTLHRRESWGSAVDRMAATMREALERHPDVWLLFPMHPNPVVRADVFRHLSGHPRAALVEPLDYLTFIRALTSSCAVATDSGGVQEEASVLGKPVLILRDVTERPEAIEGGNGLLVGTSPEAIRTAIDAIFGDDARRDAMSQPSTLFGDGQASERIAKHLSSWLQGAFQRSSSDPESAR